MASTCPVCFELLFTRGDVCTAPCGHVCHLVCWNQWLTANQICLECRRPTTGNQLIKLYFNSCDEDSLIEHFMEKSEILERDLGKAQNDLRKAQKDLEKAQKDLEKAQKDLENTQKELQAKNTCIIDLSLNLKENVSAALEARQTVQFLQEQQAEETKAKELASMYREQFLTLLKTVEESKKKKDELRKIYDHSETEMRKLRDEIEALKSKKENDPSGSRMPTDIRLLESKLKHVTENMERIKRALRSSNADNAAAGAM